MPLLLLEKARNNLLAFHYQYVFGYIVGTYTIDFVFNFPSNSTSVLGTRIPRGGAPCSATSVTL